jgi:hypothetical protein
LGTLASQLGATGSLCLLWVVLGLIGSEAALLPGA